ncbi:hypothetical protein BC940DRAFT_312479 [Gongronella butleri]|nr:hypothetical protein BC940DRAFT_312479 [Gongronella butleri]
MDGLPLELMQLVIDATDVHDLSQLCRLSRRWYIPCAVRLYETPLLTTQERHNAFFECTSARTQLFVRHLYLKPMWITNAQLSQLVFCRRLVTLRLDHCPHLLPSSLEGLLRACLLSIRHVSLANNQLAQSTLQLLGQASTLGRLRHLDLRNTLIRPCDAIDTAHHLDALLLVPPQCHGLAHLDLSYCNWVDDATLANLAHGLPLLQGLSLRWCQRLSDHAVTQLINQLKHLHMVDLCFVASINHPRCAYELLSMNPWLQKIGFTSECKSIWLHRS